MALNILGINHRTAPVEIREQVAFGPQVLGGALRDLCDLREVEEALIVSTCNRTELYGRFAADDVAPVRDWLIDHHKLPAATNARIVAPRTAPRWRTVVEGVGMWWFMAAPVVFVGVRTPSGQRVKPP